MLAKDSKSNFVSHFVTQRAPERERAKGIYRTQRDIEREMRGGLLRNWLVSLWRLRSLLTGCTKAGFPRMLVS
jgi:hypothetical protein